ncbi:MAG: hypothetical protein LBG73_04460 [Spirochaetaceae bacterium]|jgi:hypothetical protein|nr:hypothetical protein [Spirochaetaceae bacterium]
MSSIRWVRGVFAAIIITGGAVMPGLSQTPPPRYITPEALQNWADNHEAISDGLRELAEESPDPAVRARVGAYMEQMEIFAYRIFAGIEVADGRIVDTSDKAEFDNPERLYQKALRLRVPPAVQRVYAENGLGEHGHQMFICLLLWAVLLEVKQWNDIPRSNRVQKRLTALESLINPEDLAIIEDLYERM